MTQFDYSDAQNARAKLDGGFYFALAAFGLGLGLLAVLDRIGLPDELLRAGILALIFCGLTIIAVLHRTMRVKDFYVAGRCLPASYGGIVFAGAALALFLPFLPPSAADVSFTAVAIGFCLGLLWLLFAAGPALRQSGAYSFADLVVRRFPLFSVRIPVALLAAFIAVLIGLGGYEMAAQSLVAAAGTDRGTALAVIGLLLALFVVPGGLSGVIWILAAAAVVTVAALALPLGLGLMEGQALASPIFGNQMLWVESLADFDTLTGAAAQPGVDMLVVIAFGLGVSLLPPVTGAIVASRDQGVAWRCGVTGTAWLVLGTLLIAATIAGATLALKSAVIGHTAADLSPALLAASGRGAIAICGIHADDPAALAMACGSRALQLSDIRTSGLDLLTSLPLLRGAEPTLARLAAAFMIVVGAGLAAAGVQGFLTSLAHDLVPPQRRRQGPASRRLAVARALGLAFIIGAGLWLSDHSADPRVLFTFAIMVSLAMIGPLVGLAFLPQATSLSAFASLGVASFVMLHFLIYAAPPMSAAGLATNAIFAAADGLAVGLFIAMLPKKKLPQDQAAPWQAADAGMAEAVKADAAKADAE